jgi:hypothetical protein
LADPGCSLFVEGSNSGLVVERSSADCNDERQAKRVLLAAFSKSLTFWDRDGCNRPTAKTVFVTSTQMAPSFW